MGSDRLLLYASDYPHRHAADALHILQPHLSAALAQKIRVENARELYRLAAPVAPAAALPAQEGTP
jgi:predicted TIM-barrel fold metal-dependent hydrolase